MSAAGDRQRRPLEADRLAAAIEEELPNVPADYELPDDAAETFLRVVCRIGRPA